jgi:UDP-GlcNAc:undecaprenyl-phosphate/decaprenyl-phosphate GlcNAc-1-phosphate transferase
MQSLIHSGAGLVLLAFPMALGLTRLIIFLAQRNEWVVRPKADRWHQQPTALYGGVAFVVTFLLCSLIFFAQNGLQSLTALAGLLLGGAILFAVGLRDDVRALNPLVKLIGQVMAITPFLVGVLLAYPTPSAAMAMPFLLFWMLALTNAFNLLDNMDGLSAGTAVVVGGVLSIYFLLHDKPVFGVMSGILVAACLGFLWFNFRVRGHAQIFMGDCGSMFLGYVLAGLTVLGVVPSASSPLTAFLLPLLFMAIPILDTTLVIVRRKKERRPISQGGKDHSSHRLVYAGLTEKQAVLLLCGLSLLFGALGILLEEFNQPILAAFVMLGGGGGMVAFGNYLSGFTGPSRAAVSPVMLDKNLVGEKPGNI